LEELLVAILSVIGEALVEAFAEFFAVAMLDLIERSVRSLFTRAEEPSPILAASAYFLSGIALGGLSVWCLPHRVFPRSTVHGLSLAISPLLTGLLMSQVGIR
jgi:hypothetical protein